MDQAPTSCSKAVRAFNIRAWIELAISCNTAQQPYWCRLLKTEPIQTQQPDAVFNWIPGMRLGWADDDPMMSQGCIRLPTLQGLWVFPNGLQVEFRKLTPTSTKTSHKIELKIDTILTPSFTSHYHLINQDLIKLTLMWYWCVNFVIILWAVKFCGPTNNIIQSSYKYHTTFIQPLCAHHVHPFRIPSNDQWCYNDVHVVPGQYKASTKPGWLHHPHKKLIWCWYEDDIRPMPQSAKTDSLCCGTVKRTNKDMIRYW